MVRDDTEEAKDFYSKVDSNGVLWTYDDESQSYIENTQGSPMYTVRLLIQQLKISIIRIISSMMMN